MIWCILMVLNHALGYNIHLSCFCVTFRFANITVFTYAISLVNFTKLFTYWKYKTLKKWFVYKVLKFCILTLFRMGFFGAVQGLEGDQKGPLPKICHTYPTMMKLGSCTLPKEDLKSIWITWHTPWLLLTSAFFYRKLANFAISRNIPFRYIISNSFSFSQVFKDCFNKLGHNFDDVIKNFSPRPS